MAQYTHLQLYRTSYDLLLEIMNVTKNYPREFKYSLGEKIQNTAVDLIINIYRANSAKDKETFIKNILENSQVLGVYCRISFDIKVMSEAKYVHFVQELDSVSKQAQGWLRASMAQSGASQNAPEL